MAPLPRAMCPVGVCVRFLKRAFSIITITHQKVKPLFIVVQTLFVAAILLCPEINIGDAA
jgi:hypothetical protein